MTDRDFEYLTTRPSKRTDMVSAAWVEIRHQRPAGNRAETSAHGEKSKC